MKLICIHCGAAFSITADQLGKSGRCPHCREVIHLPEADVGEGERERPAPVAGGGWLSSLIPFFASLTFHTLLVLVLALITFGTTGGVIGEGEDVFIGQVPSTDLTNQQDKSLSAPAEATDATLEALDDFEELAPPTASADDSAVAEMSLVPSAPSGGQSSAGDFGGFSAGGGSGGGGWDGLITGLRRNGLDVVFVFDSTGSMGGEIDEVKSQIGAINRTLTRLIPKTRIGVVTYRDQGDDYVVKGLPLTSDIRQVQRYLDDIHAGGGGDTPEAVHSGLNWAKVENQFRPQARKVMLLFGDAPPHAQQLETCLETASDFRRQQDGVVSTVTCRARRPMSEFVEIAQAGGGEAFITTDARGIMRQLIVLVFGSEHRRKVEEAFELMER